MPGIDACINEAEFFRPKRSPDKRTHEEHETIPKIDTSDEKCLYSFEKLVVRWL